MNRGKIVILIAMVALLSLLGCSSKGSGKSDSETADTTGSDSASGVGTGVSSDSVSDSDSLSDSATNDSGTGQTGTDGTDTVQPGTDDSGTVQPGTDSSDTSPTGTDDSDTVQPGTDDSDTVQTGSDDSETNDSDSDTGADSDSDTITAPLCTPNPCGDNATCSVVDGSAVCECVSGYEGDPVAGCTDVDECSVNPCDPMTNCTNYEGTYVCSNCPAGYEGDPDTGCTDVNECDHNNGGCDPLAACTNTDGGYTCGACPAGYTGDGDVGCDDIDECTAGTFSCGANAVCVNTEGAYDCECVTGFDGVPTIACDDVNECTEIAPCDALTECTNTVGSYTCSDCPAGWTGNGASACVDVNECLDNDFPCGLNADCNNTAGSFVCACTAGFEGNALLGCDDIDECTAGTHVCDTNAACTNTSGNYYCTCDAGWSGTGFDCADINECAIGTYTCPSNASCSNAAGGYSCVCDAPAWESDGSGGCMDVNECTAGLDNCSAQATCTNISGSFNCTCNSGWEGTGVTCTDVNECLDSNGGCDPLTTCTNTTGGRVCGNCPSGYTGDGTTGCVDINECTVGTFVCDANATCANTSGDYDCVCNSGYVGNGDTCREIQGHVVLIGHDNYELNTASSRILSNSVALANTMGHIEILAVTEYVSTGPEKDNTDLAITDGLTAMGRTFSIDELTNMDLIASGGVNLMSYDVVIFYEPEQTTVGDMETFGADIEDELKTFVVSGGVLIGLDGGGHETSGLFRGADILAVSGGASATGSTLSVVDSTDLVAEGVSATYAGPSTTRSYDSATHGVVVVEDASGRPVVIHRETDVAEITLDGHVVLVGHDYYNTTSGATRALGNAVFSLTQETGTVSVLAYTGYADTSSTGEKVHTDAAIDSVAATLGRTWSRTEFSSYSLLGSSYDLNNYDVLLVYEQEDASSTISRNIGIAWQSELEDFVANGGVVVVCGGSGESWEILNQSGLMTVTSSAFISAQTIVVNDATDPVAQGVTSYTTPSATNTYSTTDGNTVLASSAGGKVVIHKTFVGTGSSFNCPVGYTGNLLDGCTDINECTLGTDACDANATCTNIDGGYNCACIDPYTGDGFTCSLGTSHTVTLSATASNGSAGGLMRGNRFYMTEDATLTEFEHYLSPSSSAYVLNWAVYESTTQTGTYSLIYSTSNTTGSTGAGWYSSGNMSVTLQAGRYYALMVQFSSTMTYYWESSYSAPSLGFGTWIGGVLEDATSVPSSISSTTSGNGYPQRVTTFY